MIQEGRGPTSGYQYGLVLVRAHFLGCKRPASSACLSPHGEGGESCLVSIPTREIPFRGLHSRHLS